MRANLGSGLEPLTQIINEARADNGSSQGKQSTMNVETPFETNAQFAETGKPCMRALDHPAMPPEPLLAFHAATGNTGRDSALLQVTLRISANVTDSAGLGVARC
ncbi:hypothetical protein QFZ89_008038 [Paraburkholderia youngii]